MIHVFYYQSFSDIFSSLTNFAQTVQGSEEHEGKTLYLTVKQTCENRKWTKHTEGQDNFQLEPRQ